jgi:hypothetical protein
LTLKTIGTPLGRPTLTQWRDRLCATIGVAYSKLSSTAQTQLNRIRDEAMDYISQRAAHEPWGIAEDASDVVDAGTDTTYPFPADVRHVIAITEETSTSKQRCATSTKADYLDAWGAGATNHDWTTKKPAVWFFDGFTSDKPPKQQWRRIGADNAGATIRIFYRPFFWLVTSTGTDQYVQLPASEVMAIESQALYKWALFTGDQEKVSMYQRAREDDIAALEINDRVASEDPIQQGVGDSFAAQLGD